MIKDIKQQYLRKPEEVGKRERDAVCHHFLLRWCMTDHHDAVSSNGGTWKSWRSQQKW